MTDGPIVTDHGAMIRRSGFGIMPKETFPENLELIALSLRWTALELQDTIKAIFLLNRARNFEDFRGALCYFYVPAHNIIYADV